MVKHTKADFETLFNYSEAVSSLSVNFGGFYDGNGGFQVNGFNAFFWIVSDSSNGNVLKFNLYGLHNGHGLGDGYNKDMGFSVRCIKK